MRIVFLDFDGVLNSRRFWPSADLADDPEASIDPAAVARVRRLVETTSAKVVISSTWRRLYPLPELVSLLERKGFVGEVVGSTPTVAGATRGGEVHAWLQASRGVRSCVLLDDDPHTAPLEHHHVRTTMEEGLLDDHVPMAEAILRRRRWWPWW